MTSVTGLRLGGCLLVAIALASCATRDGPAPVVDRSPSARSGAASAPAASASVPRPAEGLYSVKKGDTLYSIALEHGADYRDVAQWNGLEDPTKLSIGQQLQVKPPPGSGTVQVGTARGAGRLESRPLDQPLPQGANDGGPKTAPKAQRLPYSRENVASIAKDPAKAREETRPREEIKQSEAIQFIWPAKGKVIAGFAEPRSKGIDIDGKLGDPIVAAAPGRVTYIGNGIPGLGKLIVIKHENGFITVYAHNRDIMVKEQQTVARGQKIAELGATDSDRPKLHFQIRKGSAAVDPIRYLPGS
jgi:lipoprotein NlpD